MLTRSKNLILVFLIIGIIFFAFGLVMSKNALDNIKFLKISAQGEEYAAIIDEIEISTASYNEVKYGRAKVYYTDKDGNEKEGYTSYFFPVYEKPAIGSAIRIKELDGDIVETDYTPSDVYTTSTIFTCIFGGIGIIFLFIAAGVVLSNVKRNKIIRNGTFSQGTFIRAQTSVTVNNVPLYSITFSFMGRYGQEKVTTSPARYYPDEAHKLELLKKFQICVYDDQAVITENLESIELIELKQKAKDSRQFCAHCGTENTEHYLNCKNCGSNDFTTKP